MSKNLRVMMAAKAGTIDTIRPMVTGNPQLIGSAASSAARHGNLALLQALWSDVPDASTHACLKGAARQGFPDCVRWLLDAGLPVDGVEEDDSPLLSTCQYASPEQAGPCLESIELLLGAGCDVHRSDRAGMTPIMHLAMSGWSAAAVERLLAAGADPFATDNQGRSAIDLVSLSFKSRDKSAIEATLAKAGNHHS